MLIGEVAVDRRSSFYLDKKCAGVPFVGLLFVNVAWSVGFVLFVAVRSVFWNINRITHINITRLSSTVQTSGLGSYQLGRTRLSFRLYIVNDHRYRYDNLVVLWLRVQCQRGSFFYPLFRHRDRESYIFDASYVSLWYFSTSHARCGKYGIVFA